MRPSLNALPCFNTIEYITEIESGFSQRCFKVCADNKVYFAKTINDNTEALVSTCANNANLSPAVIYHDDNWLISQFIDANNIELSAISTDNKIKHTIKLMVQCHQLTIQPAELAVKDIISSLVNKTHYSTPDKTILLQFSEWISIALNIRKKGVCCHGDLNFSNVLMDQMQKTWLIDYECACTAPVEFDLAMFIAVNNITKNKVATIIEQYEVQSSVNVAPKLLNNYLLFCYFINALWYLNTYQDAIDIENKKELLIQTKAQWFRLQSSLKASGLPLFSSLSIKLTDILTTFDLSKQT